MTDPTSPAPPTRPLAESADPVEHADAVPAPPPSTRAALPPWLSILIPVYNVADYLTDCLDSVCGQATPNIEILVLDDASTDGSGALLRALARERPRIRCLAHPVNRGLSAARNTLLDAATGRYVWFLDSDDLLAPGAIAELRAVVAAEAPDLVLCDHRRLKAPRQPGQPWVECQRQRPTFSGPRRHAVTSASRRLRGLFDARGMHIWSKIARRDLWQPDLRFPENQVFEDISTSPLLMLRAREVWYAPRAWVLYRQRSQSILLSPPTLDKARQLAISLVAVRERIDPRPLSWRTRLSWGRFALRVFRGACRMVDTCPAIPPPTLLPDFRRAFEASLPISARQLLLGSLLSGRWIVAGRLLYWWRRAA